MMILMRVPTLNPFYRVPRRAWHIAATCVLTSVYGLALDKVFTPPPFGHYQPILDRMPFGSLPSDFNAVPVDPSTLKNEAQVKADQQTLAKKINMSAVNITPDGRTAIGFTDLSQTPPINHYLLVGASADGWTVVSANYDEDAATIEKDGVVITLKLGKGLVDPATLPAQAVAAQPLLRSKGGLVPQVAPETVRPPEPLAQSSGKRGPASQGALTRNMLIPAVIPMPADADAGAVVEPVSEPLSYAERQRERATQQTAAQLAAEVKQREQLEKLARAAAATEIKRREEEAAQAAPAEDPQAQQEQIQ